MMAPITLKVMMFARIIAIESTNTPYTSQRRSANETTPNEVNESPSWRLWTHTSMICGIQAKMPITPARSPIASIHMAAMNQQRRTNPHEAFSLFDVS